MKAFVITVCLALLGVSPSKAGELEGRVALAMATAWLESRTPAAPSLPPYPQALAQAAKDGNAVVTWISTTPRPEETPEFHHATLASAYGDTSPRVIVGVRGSDGTMVCYGWLPANASAATIRAKVQESRRSSAPASTSIMVCGPEGCSVVNVPATGAVYSQQGYYEAAPQQGRFISRGSARPMRGGRSSSGSCSGGG